MNKSAQLAKQLETLKIEDGIKLIEKAGDEGIHFNVFGDAMCIMHDDGSVAIIEIMGGGVNKIEVISPENVLKVLHHYRPFKEVLKNNLQ